MSRDGDEGYPLPVVAFRLFDMSCRSGSSKACNAVGWAKLRGEGTSADAAAAGASFAKACPTGKEDRYSCDSRGFALVTGLARTTVDVGQGSRILRAACDAGTIHSCAALAALGAMLGTPVDRQVTDSACQYDPHKVAAHCDRTGDPQSCALAGGWLKVGLCGAPIAAERAKALLDKAAAGGARWPAPAR
jgi:TPR repeat protein